MVKKLTKTLQLTIKLHSIQNLEEIEVTKAVANQLLAQLLSATDSSGKIIKRVVVQNN